MFQQYMHLLTYMTDMCRGPCYILTIFVLNNMEALGNSAADLIVRNVYKPAVSSVQGELIQKVLEPHSVDEEASNCPIGALESAFQLL